LRLGVIKKATQTAPQQTSKRQKTSYNKEDLTRDRDEQRSKGEKLSKELANLQEFMDKRVEEITRRLVEKRLDKIIKEQYEVGNDLEEKD